MQLAILEVGRIVRKNQKQTHTKNGAISNRWNVDGMKETLDAVTISNHYNFPVKKSVYYHNQSHLDNKWHTHVYEIEFDEPGVDVCISCGLEQMFICYPLGWFFTHECLCISM